MYGTLDLSVLYMNQFIEGCHLVNCNNPLCKRNPDNILTNKSNDELKSLAERLSHESNPLKGLCLNQPYTLIQPMAEQTIKDFNVFGEKLITGMDMDMGEITRQIQLVIGNQDLCALVFLKNNKTLSDTNSSIDDNIMLEFSTKLSSIPDISVLLLDTIKATIKHILGKMNNTTFTALRCLCIIMYFPQIIDPLNIDELLTPIISTLAKDTPKIKSILIAWMKKLPNLIKQLVGACHFAISMYFANNLNASPSSKPILTIINAMSLLYEANIQSENKFPPSFFNNHHIDEKIVVKNEISKLKSQTSFSFLSVPFILCLKTKAEICKLETQQLLNSLIYHTEYFGSEYDASNSHLIIKVRRDHLLDDAIFQLTSQNTMNFLKKLKVVFEKESAVDIGGPSREFLYLISEKLCNPDYGMFHIKYDRFYWFTPFTYEGERSFFLVGAVVGLAVHNRIVLPIRFPLVLFKKILHPEEVLTLADLKEIDEPLAKGLQNILDMVKNDEDVSVLSLSFQATIECFGEPINVPLIDGMEDVEVTNDNADLYVDAYIQWMLDISINTQYQAFRRGFELACKAPSYKILEPSELDMLVSGVDSIDWDSLKIGVKYKSGYNKNSRAVKWFWEIYDSMTIEEKKKLLKFVTGTDRAPIGGLAKVRLAIQKLTDLTRLPISHTCFNTFGLPDYRTKAEMKKKILTAIQYTEGFGFA